ncbi:MAG: PilZ domain-containing protein [Alteromonadaceae bacterium]|nr:PilZ domain-containing protein [Alteromonadaceae bacterium]
MVDFDDKRYFYRMMLNSEVKVTIIDDEANSCMLSTCRDISATGLAIEMSHPLDIGTNVKVSLLATNDNVQALDTRGKVIRVTEESNDCYLIGLSIEEVD